MPKTNLVLAGLTFALLSLSSGQQVTAQADASPSDALVIEEAQTSLIQNVFIATPVSGVVSAVEVQEGDRVQADTSLVTLENDLAEKELVSARAGLDAARLESDNDVNLRFAQRTLQVREHEMKQSRLANETYAGAVSDFELEEIRLKVDQAALAIEQARHDLMIAAAAAVEKQAAVSIAQTRLDQHSVASRVEGTVAEVDVQPGQWVEAGAKLVRVISLDPLRVEGFIDGRKHGPQLIGRNVRFTPAGASEDESLTGRISFVSRELHPVTGQVRLWATVDNPDGRVGSGTPGRLVVE
ncbi:putative efflux pump membrane fusion protein [Stieleria maiorica]|uniref:Putative efflux pump membrane fusion protein n=1 Tax=Stieleria maiorica TaxID=2795974 RepID=A0A5B9MHT5_9BACT|nr:HlyD family efflux transporter periplasmic adaptor subunit [Stieleria maiorica]QEG00863.1 putative efflux pump membrane fusion protein [Stieleria maiorica]